MVRQGPVARVPAVEIVSAVTGQIRGRLRAPEVGLATWRAAEIVEAILARPQPKGLAMERARQPFPVEWKRQEHILFKLTESEALRQEKTVTGTAVNMHR